MDCTCFWLIQFLQEKHRGREAVSYAVLLTEKTRRLRYAARSIGILLRGPLCWLGVG